MNRHEGGFRKQVRFQSYSPILKISFNTKKSHSQKAGVLTNQLAVAAALATALSVNSVNKKHPQWKIMGPLSHTSLQIDRLKRFNKWTPLIAQPDELWFKWRWRWRRGGRRVIDSGEGNQPRTTGKQYERAAWIASRGLRLRMLQDARAAQWAGGCFVCLLFLFFELKWQSFPPLRVAMAPRVTSTPVLWIMHDYLKAFSSPPKYHRHLSNKMRAAEGSARIKMARRLGRGPN